MNRPWKIWVTFSLCSLLVLGVMAWVSHISLRLDRAQARARAQADLEEKVRLALWRMDSMLSPLLAQESARPYLAYSAFYSTERPYPLPLDVLPPTESLFSSPLLTQTSANVLLHFQFDPTGRITSPQIPEGPFRELAIARFTDPLRISTAESRLLQLKQILSQPAANPGPSAPSKSNRDVLFEAAPAPTTLNTIITPVLNPPVERRLQKTAEKKSVPAQSLTQRERNAEELQFRAQSLKQNYDLSVDNLLFNSPAKGRFDVAEGLFKPVWFGNALVLVRRVTIQQQPYIQGCWLDWDAIKRSLLENVQDLLPSATLEPIASNLDDPQTRLLASLPVRLIPGPVDFSYSITSSPIRFALVLAWACVLLAGIAIAFLLGGTLSLSERRAAFVSAVTHELRTPLTTFKMYSEMLASNMVPDSSRAGYLATLCAEANRLQHLVENVLAYARLERGNADARTERLTLRELIDRVKPRLVQRSQQAGMDLLENFDPRALDTCVHVDVAAVEQILFNLVDNACKYASDPSTQKTIHLEAFPENHQFALLRIRDHGRGISSEAAKRLFQPFSKSATQAAHSAPGVGLGLALSRRLARSLRGDLRLSPNLSPGASFDLLLPLASAST